MHSRLDVRALALLVALSSTACGPFHRGADESGQIVFTNDSIDQADVYASTPGGDPVRIGTVFGSRTETLRLPATFTSGTDFVVIARILAKPGSLGSGRLTLRSGESLQIRLPSDEKTLVVLPGR